jgi:hypothetical protein
MLYRAAQKHDVRDAAQNAGVITMGINPSKRDLHLGHYVTLFNAHRALASAPGSVGMFYVDDREHHSKHSTEGDAARFTMSAPETVESVRQLMEAFLRSLDAQLHTSVSRRVRIVPMHEYMMEGASSTTPQLGGQLYDLLWENRAKITNTFHMDNPFNEAPFVMPFCTECRSGTRIDEMIFPTTHAIRSNCINLLCPRRDMQTEAIPHHDTNWSMHYTVDPLRDALLSQQFSRRRVLHIFGGDYGLPWGMYGVPKAERLHTVLTDIAPGKVDYYVGPLLRRNGQKLAKSNGDKTRAAPKASALQELATAGAIVDL